MSKLIEISGVQYRVTGAHGPPPPLDDGIFDSPEEAFTFTTSNLTVGTHKVGDPGCRYGGNGSARRSRWHLVGVRWLDAALSE